MDKLYKSMNVYKSNDNGYKFLYRRNVYINDKATNSLNKYYIRVNGLRRYVYITKSPIVKGKPSQTIALLITRTNLKTISNNRRFK